MNQQDLSLRTEWKVESFTEKGKFYNVERFGDEFVCDCPSFENRHLECKHIKKVKKDIDIGGESGNDLTAETNTKKPEKSRSYPDRNEDKFEMRCKNGHLLSDEISALQKTVRRGEEYKAVYFAYSIHFSGFGKYLWRRLNVICCEDLGITSNVIIHVNALRQMWDNNIKTIKTPTNDDFLFPLQAVLAMCRVPKIREGDSLANLVAEDYKEEKHIPIPDYAIDPHTEKGKRIWGRWNTGTEKENCLRVKMWFDEWSKVIPESPREDKYKEILKKKWGYYRFTYDELKDLKIEKEAQYKNKE